MGSSVAIGVTISLNLATFPGFLEYRSAGSEHNDLRVLPWDCAVLKHPGTGCRTVCTAGVTPLECSDCM